MRIAVIGSGKIGGTLVGLFTRAGHEVAVTNSHGPESMSELVQRTGAGVTAVAIADAAVFGDLVFAAIPFGAWSQLELDGLDGRVLVDCSNYYEQRDGALADGDRGVTTTELVALRHPDAHVVKAFNTMDYESLGSRGRPDAPLERRLALPLAGDVDDAKHAVAHLIIEVGFAPVDTGTLGDGGPLQQPDGPLYTTLLTAADARAAIEKDF